MSYELDISPADASELAFIDAAQVLLQRSEGRLSSTTMLIWSEGKDGVISFNNGEFFSAKVETEEANGGKFYQHHLERTQEHTFMYTKVEHHSFTNRSSGEVTVCIAQQEHFDLFTARLQSPVVKRVLDFRPEFIPRPPEPKKRTLITNFLCKLPLLRHGRSAMIES